MKSRVLPVLLTLAGAGCLPLMAQPTNETEQLRFQVRQLQESLDRLEREQRLQIEELNRRLETLTRQQAEAAEKAKLERGLAAEMTTNPPPVSADAPAAAPPAADKWSPASPIQLKSGNAYLDLGLVGTFAVGGSTADDIAGGTELGGHDPNQRGFTIQGVEANFAGAVDPYFRGNLNVLFQVDADGESLLELEEGWLETLSLPAGFQVRAGQLMTDFGRQNPTHVHAWAFVDTPLVLGRFLGPDGLRNPGARLSWLAPTPFYSELLFSIQNSQGETAASFRSDDHSHGGTEDLPLAYRHPDNDRGVNSLGDLLLSPRYALSFDLTDTQVLLLGASGAFGPNSRGAADSGETTTQIYGVDLTWKWKSAFQHGGFPFVSFQTEALLRHYDAGAFDWDENGNGLTDPGEIEDAATGRPALLAGETLTDYGFYSQVLYGFRKGWVAGLRVDFITGDTADYERQQLTLDGEWLPNDPQRTQRWRLSPSLTWYPTEYSKLRLQYNYDDREDAGPDHSVWLQFEFLLGAHAAHKF